MTISTGYPQLQPKFILGTDQWISEAAEQMVGSDMDKLNQLREHFPFYSLAKGRTILRPTVATLTTADFVGASPDPIKAPLTVLTDPPEEFDLTSLSARSTSPVSRSPFRAGPSINSVSTSSSSRSPCVSCSGRSSSDR